MLLVFIYIQLDSFQMHLDLSKMHPVFIQMHLNLSQMHPRFIPDASKFILDAFWIYSRCI
jgi:hypothetical protein